MKVLIADDSALLRKNISKLIVSAFPDGIISEAEDVGPAMEAVSSRKFDVVILDLQMPGGSGFDVLEHIKKTANTCPVIILTNHATEHFRQKSEELGADFFLDKSNEYERIVDLLKNITTDRGEE